jgi:glutamate N-acetyltransferase/amino-acid N-acetyltransferase
VKGVTAARGFVAGGIASGIKNGLDLALVDAGAVVAAAAVFTSSRAPAPPVIVGRRRIESGRLRAVLLNSGCANAATGAGGMADTLMTTHALAQELGCEAEDVLPCSTGPIGPRLPAERIAAAAGTLVSSCGDGDENAEAAATAIMTTDTVSKQAERAVDGYVVGGMAKGAGMLRPDMATMLAVITTDAAVDSEVLASTLGRAVDVSFNSLNVDGCMSTNDTVVLLSSGASGIRPDADAFGRALAEVCEDLALQIARDAEGSSRVVTIRIDGAASDVAARKAGRAITDSGLVRSSFFGGDPNWGRIVAALGAADVAFDIADVEIRFAGRRVAAGGVATGEKGGVIEGDFSVEVTIGAGPGSARILTTDLTPEYVRFNAEPS